MPDSNALIKVVSSTVHYFSQCPQITGGLAGGDGGASLQRKIVPFCPLRLFPSSFMCFINSYI